MKRLDFKLEGDLLHKAFPLSRIKTRNELLIILLETIRYIFFADRIDTSERVDNRLVIYIDDMQRLFFFSHKKYYSISFPFTLGMVNDSITLHWYDINVDSELISNLITIISSKDFHSDSHWDFLTSVDDYEKSNPGVWILLRFLMTYDIGYLRFDDDEDGFLKAKSVGRANMHPRYHIDINYSNGATFKNGLLKNINYNDFIELIDNKQDRWFLSPC